MENLAPQSLNEDLTSSEVLEKNKKDFQSEIRRFQETKVGKLRSINHWWNLSLTVAGITFTLLTTVLGVVENNRFQGLTKFALGTFGAAAVAAQSANSEFRVRRKAGEYTVVEAEAHVLEHQVPYVKSVEELDQLRHTYYSLVRKTAEIEASIDENK